MNRTFRYSAGSYRPLQKQNRPHLFAMSHALRLYSANAIYSFIPKNACSTMRVSLALANGCIQDEKDFNWIHYNNDTFCTDLANAYTAAYTFVILRCPYSRLASVYLDKIVGHNRDAWDFHDLTKRCRPVGDISFEFFIKHLQNKEIREANIHWRPQVDFLLYQQYDDYFCLENFSQAVRQLAQKIQLSVVDARGLTQHGVDTFQLLGKQGEYAKHSAFSILQMKHAGQCPSSRSLYTDELIALVKEMYADDIELYQSLFGSKNLLFV